MRSFTAVIPSTIPSGTAVVTGCNDEICGIHCGHNKRTHQRHSFNKTAQCLNPLTHTAAIRIQL